MAVGSVLTSQSHPAEEINDCVSFVHMGLFRRAWIVSKYQQGNPSIKKARYFNLKNLMSMQLNQHLTSKNQSIVLFQKYL